METTRWLNPTQPQTLQSAVILLYIHAAFTVLFGFGRLGGLGLLLVAAYVAGGLGIANDRRWGYYLALAAAASPFVIGFLLAGWAGVIPTTFQHLLSVAFDILLLALLLHPLSRDHQRTWFR